ncbi:MAG: MBL fold metallo-hydrolase [Desulfobacterales bacterium]|jgi:L-ascorbate metabolism protein UlaG (beta-lactamase superfamily)|nr:MBL fold metallo-hydrolase [Desulfobacterales bacterium]
MVLESFLKKIVWLGHDGFRIDGSRTLYIDPFQTSSTVKADIILVSHEHFDHCSPNDIARIQQDHTVIVTEKNSAAKLSGDVRVVTPGDVVMIGEVTITAVPAYNIGKPFHPKANGWLGFVVEIDGVRVYHAGDTDFIPEMKHLQIDVALLPVSGTYVMTADEAIQAARTIKPRVVIPMHYGTVVGAVSDAERVKAALSGEMDVVVLKPA